VKIWYQRSSVAYSGIISSANNWPSLLLYMRFYLLGQFRVEGLDGVAPLTLPRLRKAQGLLAYLLLYHDKAHPRDHLASIFWGDVPEERARDSLSTALKEVRTLLAATNARLESDRFSVKVVLGTAWLDVAVLRRGLAEGATRDEQAKALGLYTAELLEGWQDEWCIEEREHLRQRVLRTGYSLLQHYYDACEWQSGVELAQRLMKHDPFDDSVQEWLLRMLLGAGNYAEARRQYQRFAAAMRTELDSEPQETVRKLYVKALERSATRSPEAGARGSEFGLLGSIGATVRVPAHLPYVGRISERIAIRDACLRLKRGDRASGGLLLVRGEAGSGKTRLVEESLAEAVSVGSLRVARGRGTELARDVPFGLILEPLTRWLVEELAPEQVLSRLGHTTAGALAQILPSLHARLPGLRPLPALPPAEAQTRVLSSIISALLACTAPGSPGVLFLDDVHWSDNSTLRVLDGLSARLAGTASNLLVIGAYRAEEVAANAQLEEFVYNWESAGGRMLTVQPLTLGEIHQLVEQRISPERATLSQWLHKQSGGNAFYLAELLRTLVEQGEVVSDPVAGSWAWNDYATHEGMDTNGIERLPLPTMPGVQKAVLARFTRLSEEARTIGRVAAVMGEGATFELIATASSLPEESALAGLEELLSRRFLEGYTAGDITSGGEVYRYAHDIARQAVYSSLSTPRRSRLHEQVALAMERSATFASLQSELPTLMKLAYHYGQTNNVDKQRHYFAQVAEVAQANYANDVAVDHYQRLIPLMPPLERPGVMFKFAYLLYVVGRWPDSEALCWEALRLAQETGNMELVMRAKLEISMQMRLGDSYEEALAQSHQALDLFTTLNLTDRRLLLKAQRERGINLYMLARYEEASAQMRQALPLARELEDKEAICKLLSRLGDIHTNFQEYEQALRYQEEALEFARQMGDLPTVAWVTFAIARCYRFQKDIQRAAPAVLETLRLIEQTGYQGLLTAAVSVLGSSYYIYGEYEHAYACAAYHLHVAVTTNRLYSIGFALGNVARAYTGLGLVDVAIDCWKRAVAVARSINSADEQGERLGSIAQLLADKGEYEQALAVTKEAAIVAEESQEVEYQSKLALLSAFLRVKLGILSPADASAECDAFVGAARTDDERAAILYTKWRIAPQDEGLRAQAAEMYRQLYTNTPTAEYRARYTELAGVALPPAPPPPPPPPPHKPPPPPRNPPPPRIYPDAPG
jgi:DNA-binding SARP family transcriptional activator/tetratricopeptide (TPR) repeat protein